MTIERYWPLFALRLVTSRLVLRLPGDDDLAALARLIEEGIHDPAQMPFDDPPWTDEPSPGRERAWLQRQWQQRAAWDPAQWRLRLLAEHEGQPVGMQDLVAASFPSLGVVSTYSWLGRAWQGRGFGKEMRAAVLALAFDRLGARQAESTAFEDNHASVGVSRALGYEENGREWMLRRGSPAPAVRFRMTPALWRALARPPTAIEGLEACLDLFGLGEGGP